MGSRFTAILVAVTCLTSGSMAQDDGVPSGNLVPTELQSLDQTLAGLVGHDHAGSLAAAIVVGGEPYFISVHGYAERETCRVADRVTSYHMASVSKPFVAIAAVQLALDGQLDLDAPISTYLPEFYATGEGADGITMRHLLTHRSGLPDVVDYEWERNDDSPGAAAEYVESLRGIELIGAPGEQLAYSNLAYDIAGHIIAEISGVSFEAFMERHVLVPANMASASYLRSDIPSDIEAVGYSGREGARASVYPYNRRHAPSSTLHASIDDMAGFLSVMTMGEGHADPILGVDGVHLMFEESLYRDEEGRQIVLGWLPTTIGDHRVYEHNGFDVGFASYIAIFPDQQIGLVLMSNSPRAAQFPDAMRAVQGAVLDLLNER